ncbi:MAG: phosphogluconate dehydrogenase (NADP(+)-dependent, decarboxylating) [Acidobacteria bacterium 13_1_20CM_3_53_8]|nr:MAG: phosphogluconate dehydrogenase (NADP(+)-dependent, decarboxylating) [Acidobacteria bacterium 13_1_20CM_3_53_8]
MPESDIGMAGVGVMGSNLALNMESHGFSVVVWDRDPSFVEKAMAQVGEGKRITPTKTPEEFVRSIKRPRKIMIMVKAGAPVDWTVEQFKPFLDHDDILIDGGNSFFEDTRRREAALKDEGFRFIGSGVSGGEEGALHGPSLMPGGAREAYEEIRPIWEAIAAKTEDGACTTYVGPNAAGHFVKMVHNGIEYGDMQLIAEAYDILRRVLGMEAAQLADVFAKWNEGILDSYLIQITSEIFRVKDEETGKPLVDLILDKAGQKGTGKWTSQTALDLGVPISTIGAALDARFMSALKEERVEASKRIKGPQVSTWSGDGQYLIAAVHDALYASKICSYAQGFNLIRAGSDEWQWNIDSSEMARIWKGGCIIRAKFLDGIKKAYKRTPDLKNLLLDEEFSGWMEGAQKNWRTCLSVAQQHGVAVPAMAASLAYFDSYRTERLPQNLTQAQRDFFGAHTYERVDKPQLGAVHTKWEEEVAKSGK